MRTKGSTTQWTPENDDYLRNNLSDGTVKLSEHFGVSLASIRKRCNLIGLSLRLNKAETPTVPKPTKADISEKFNPSQHKIKNSSIEGLIPLWIAKDRMYVYCKPGQDLEQVRQKYEGRSKNYF